MITIDLSGYNTDEMEMIRAMVMNRANQYLRIKITDSANITEEYIKRYMIDNLNNGAMRYAEESSGDVFRETKTNRYPKATEKPVYNGDGER